MDADRLQIFRSVRWGSRMKKRARWMETKHKSPNRWQLQSLLNVLALLSCLPFCTLATSVETELSSDAILTKVAEGTAKSHAMAYFGLREYRLRNCRFDKEAVALVQVTYHPDSGKELTPLQKSGSSKLLEILEKLIASEIEVGKPTKSFDYDISPANYRALLGGVSDAGGRSCFLIELIPRRKSKYLIKFSPRFAHPPDCGDERTLGEATM